MKFNNTKELITQLEQFRRIHPRAEFSQDSKRIILSTPYKSFSQKTTITPSWDVQLQYGFSSIVRIGSFIGIGLSILIISLYATHELSPVLFPGLSPQSITAEAEMLNSNMNIELSRLGYFDTTAQESSAALKQLSQKQFNHLNDTIITSEATALQETISTPSDDTTQINALINQLSN
ncbi:MAG: hypothetical protein WC099_01140 [Candidatus Paceibacterota bacterium]